MLASAGTTKRLPGGDVGYYMRRPDDCLAAAVATVLQTPIAQVPDARLDARIGRGESPESISRGAWRALAEWAASRGLEVEVHGDVPVEARRWIGVCRPEGDSEQFHDHCLVMDHGTVVFDPNPPGVPAMVGALFGREFEGLLLRARKWGVQDIHYGLVFVEAQSQTGA